MALSAALMHANACSSAMAHHQLSSLHSASTSTATTITTATATPTAAPSRRGARRRARAGPAPLLASVGAASTSSRLHALPPQNLSTSISTSIGSQLCTPAASRRSCCRLSRPTVALALSNPDALGSSLTPSRGPAPTLPSHPTTATANTRVLPSAASGAGPTGPTGRSYPPPQGAASSSSLPFNPRYSTHHQHHSHGGQQHMASSSAHPHGHPHANGPSVAPGRGGAWATPGPLATGSSSSGGGGGGGGSGASHAGYNNPRYDPAYARSLPSAAPSAPARSAAPEDSRPGSAGGAGAGAVVSSSPMSTSAPALATAPPAASGGAAAIPVTAAARQPPRHGSRSSGPSMPSPFQPEPHTQLSSKQQQLSYTAAVAPSVPMERGPAAMAEGRPAPAEVSVVRQRTQLERLYIKDFALVSEQTVRLGPGVNVITGESGSGKSVLVEAFSQVLGSPAPQECIRAPAEMAVIEGTFHVGEEQREPVWQLLSTSGLPQRALAQLAADGGGSGGGNGSTSGGDGAFRLTVRREISHAPAGGLRSRVFLNGAATSLRVLRELGGLLVDTNGQHSSMSLRDPATQLDLLDRIAGTSPLADSYCAALARLREVEGRLDELDELDDEQERATMQKLVDAVAKLRVRPGEERELRRTLKRMEARRNAVEQCGLVRMALCGEGGAGGVTDALRTIEAQLNAILAQEEQNRAAAAAAAAAAKSGGGKGKDGAKPADGDAAGSSSGTAAGEDEAGGEDEEEEEGGEGGGGAGGGAQMMEAALEQVAAAKDMLAAAETTVRAYARRYQFSQADHDATTERLARIERLMKQASAAGFGGGGGGGVRGGGRGGGSRIISTEQLLEVAEDCSSKLAAYYEMEGQREDWEAQLEVLVTELRATALQLSSRRRAAAAALRSAVESCLRELAMGGSRFDVRIGWAEERLGGNAVEPEGLYVSEEEAEEAGVSELGGRTYVMGARGLDQVEFLLAAGPAEPLRPLAAVASGGESARVMLALKAAPAQAMAAATASAAAAAASTSTVGGREAGHAPQTLPMAGGGLPIMILDELDSGIGARLGSAVGSILARMAAPTHGSNSQIICVTHLPQVACYAAHHIKVQKDLQQQLQQQSAAQGRVTTSFLPLTSFEERCEEVAAMLGLDRGVAEEMLRAAQSQVASLYPPGTAPGSFSPQQQRQPVAGTTRGSRATRGSPTLSVSGGDSDDSPAGDASADGIAGAAGLSFAVVVAPAMDPNAVLVPDGGSDAEEAELSAQLLAGVEAAAMQHLRRMEAQAKAAAAAAAAAASIVVPQSMPPVADDEGAAAAAKADVAASSVVAAAAATVQELDAITLAELEAAIAAKENGSGGFDVPLAELAAALSGSAAAASSHSAVDEGTSASSNSTSSSAVTAVTAAAGDGVGSSAVYGVAVEQSSAATPREPFAIDPPVAPVTAVQSAPSAPPPSTAAAGAVSVDVSTSSAAPNWLPPPLQSSTPPGATAPAAPRVAVAVPSSGLVVNVQPSRAPLPYNFGPADEVRDDSDGEGDASTAVAAKSYDDTRDVSQLSRDPGSLFDSEYDEEFDEPRRQRRDAAAIDGTSDGKVAEGQYYSGAAADDRYMYGVGVGGGVGGRFVAVPNGHEHEEELREMFQAIMSFSREDYAGEAMRTYEATLWEALRDSGMA